jgi:hypothetical protein
MDVVSIYFKQGLGAGHLFASPMHRGGLFGSCGAAAGGALQHVSLSTERYVLCFRNRSSFSTCVKTGIQWLIFSVPRTGEHCIILYVVMAITFVIPRTWCRDGNQIHLCDHVYGCISAILSAADWLVAALCCSYQSYMIRVTSVCCLHVTLSSSAHGKTERWTNVDLASFAMLCNPCFCWSVVHNLIVISVDHLAVGYMSVQIEVLHLTCMCISWYTDALSA